MAGGFRGGGFHGGGFRGRGFGRGLAFGGFYGPYGYDDYDGYGYGYPYAYGYGYGYPYGYGNPYAYDDSYVDNGDCHVVQRRVHSAKGWHVRPVQVCG
jgi:hypothetical protein